MNNWKTGFVEANRLNIHYTRTGGDHPPLVLSHGITDDGLCWTPVAERLAAAYDVVMVDARGHGRSDDPVRGYDYLSQAEDLAGVITALGLQMPIAMGHSMGAVSTLVFAGLYPDVPGAILLEDPPPRWMPPGQPTPDDLAAREQFLSSIEATKHKTRQELYDAQRQAFPSWSEAELQPWVDSKQRFSLNILDIFNDDRGRNVDWQALIGRITCPVMLITADLGLGAIVSPESVEALRELLQADLEIAHIPGAGHNIRREQFEGYMAAVRAFLAKL